MSGREIVSEEDADQEMLGRRLLEDAKFVATVPTIERRLVLEGDNRHPLARRGFAMRLARDLYPDDEYLADEERRGRQLRALSSGPMMIPAHVQEELMRALVAP